MSSCPFCDIIEGRAPAKVRRCEPDAWWIVPLNPVTHGHTLVIPTIHVPDALADPAVAARTMELAARWADYPCNLITSCGPEATQTVKHLHIHIVPRRRGDGLALPWTAQQPCGGRCEFHGRLWCHETGRSCEEFIAELERRDEIDQSRAPGALA